MNGIQGSARRETVGYLVGYVLATALTIVAFSLVRWQLLDAARTLACVFGFELCKLWCTFVSSCIFGYQARRAMTFYSFSFRPLSSSSWCREPWLSSSACVTE